MSGVDKIKNSKRQQKEATETLLGVEDNVDSNEERKKERMEERKVERKRVSFDLRTDIHRDLKMQSIVQEKNIYILIEEALEKYLKEGGK